MKRKFAITSAGADRKPNSVAAIERRLSALAWFTDLTALNFLAAS
jgi:hypothetical protein